MSIETGELYAVVVAQAREVLLGLLSNTEDTNFAGVLRRVADVANKYIELLIALDPSYAGPPASSRAASSGLNLSPYTSVIGEAYGAPPMNNETFAASAISQLVGVASNFQIGKNLENTTAALIAAKAAGLGEVSSMLEAKLKSLMGHSETEEPSLEMLEMPPEAVPVEEEGGAN